MIALFFVSAVPQFNLRDTEAAGPVEWAGRKAVLLYFVTVDCPVQTLPEMTSARCLWYRLLCGAGRPVGFAEAEESRYARDYRYKSPPLDPAQTLVRHANATVTPQVAVSLRKVKCSTWVRWITAYSASSGPEVTQSYVRQVLGAPGGKPIDVAAAINRLAARFPGSPHEVA